MATEPRRPAPAECFAQGEEAIDDPTRTVELIAIKDGWLATTPDSRCAAYGTTKEAALAAWAQSEERAARLLKRYWRRFPGAVLATFERERSDGD
jgi:cytidylate kinase